MTQFNRRLSELEQRQPARRHTCEVVKCWPAGKEEVIATFWTNHPVTRILVKYGEWRQTDGTNPSPTPGQPISRVGD